MAYSPYTWHDGEAGGTLVTAARLNALEQALAAASATTDPPTSWTPTFLNATVGNGILVGFYWWTAGGRILNGKFDWTWGTTSAMSATAALLVTLPASVSAASNFTNVGSGSIKDFSTDTVHHADLVLQGATTQFALYLDGGGKVMASGTPFVFTANDHISGTFSVPL